MSRYYSGSSEEHQPVTWVRGYPVYAVHFVVVVLSLAMVATAIFMNRNAGFWMEQLPFISPLVLTGEVWRIFSYGFVQPPNVWLVVDYVMLVWFGREVERHVGRKIFFSLYGLVYLAPPIVLTLIGLVMPTALHGGTGALAVFTAFATLYPGAMLMFNILAKWAAVILVGVYTLMHLANRNYGALIALWTSTGFAWLFIRYHQGLLVLPRLRLPRRKPKLRVLPDPKSARTPRSEKQPYASTLNSDSAMAEVDALLDKIATSGISSLTPKERAKLEAAREGLLKRSASRE